MSTPPLRSAALTLLAAIALPPPAAATRPVHVVELFQSRDCPACPAARTNLDALAVRADTLALSWPVSFRAPADWAAAGARAEFMQRQADYVAATGIGEVATPQMIFNGRLVLPGNDAAQVAVALRHATALEARPQLAVEADRLVVSGRPPRGATLDLWLIEYIQVVASDRRDNEAPMHRNLVRAVRRLARWSGGPLRLAMPRPAPGRSGAILLQQIDMGAIVAALEVPPAVAPGFAEVR
jgi:hypothetical protein